jgi:hypothetical protein
MNSFSVWLSTGAEHILNWNAYDHLLFIVLLSLAFPYRQWKRLLILITAFTVGHSLSLGLSVILRLNTPTPWIELLIALSILITGIYELIKRSEPDFLSLNILYGITACFGLIHGLGYSFLLRSLLGNETNVILPLLYFNIGLELGQLILVLGLTVFSLLLNLLSNALFKNFKLIVLCSIALIALKITIERLLLLF